MRPKKFMLPTTLIALLLFILATILMLKPTLDLLVEPRGQSFDWLPIWAGGRAVLAGEDPYGLEVTRRIQLAVFRQLIPPDEYQHGFSNPAHLAFVLLPFMILPFSFSLLLWLSLQIPLFMVNLLLGLQLLKWPVRPSLLFLLTLLALLGFRYPINVYMLGQLTFFVIFCMLLSLWLFQRGWPRWAAVALAGATIRPDLSLLAILLSLLFLWRSPFRYQFFTTLLLVGLGLALLPIFFIGFWPLAWLEELQGYVKNPFATWPPGLLPWAGVRLVLEVGLLAWIGYSLWRAWREPTPFSQSLLISAALLGSLLLLLQTGSYNLTLALIPALILIRYARPIWLKALITTSLLTPWFYFWLGPAFDRLIFLLIPGQFIFFQLLVELFPLKESPRPTDTVDKLPPHQSPHASSFPPTWREPVDQ